MHAHPTGHGLDTYVLEHAVKPSFWVMGIFIISFWIATLIAGSRNRSTPSVGTASANNSFEKTATAWSSKSSAKAVGARRTTPPAPRFTAWLCPYLTTMPRRALALAIYLVGLGAQLLEGYWIVVTLGRWTAKLLHQWPAWAACPAWVYGVYMLSTGVMVLVDLAAVVFGGIIVLFQTACILELLTYGILV